MPLLVFQLFLSHGLALFRAHLCNLTVAVLDLLLLLLDELDELVHAHVLLVLLLFLQDLGLLDLCEELICPDLPLGVALHQLNDPGLLGLVSRP